MRYVAIILAIIVVSVAFAADNDFGMKFRGQSCNGTFDQITFYPSYKLGETVSFNSVMLFSKSSEFSTGLKFSAVDWWIWPMAGLLYSTEKGYTTHFRGSFHFGMERSNFEFVGQNILDLANERSINDTYHRWWVQYGDKSLPYHARIGIQTEITNTEGKKATVILGPKFSLFKNEYRVDCFYGKIVQHSGAIASPMIIRIWLYINM